MILAPLVFKYISRQMCIAADSNTTIKMLDAIAIYHILNTNSVTATGTGFFHSKSTDTDVLTFYCKFSVPVLTENRPTTT